MSGVWDICLLDAVQESEIQQIATKESSNSRIVQNETAQDDALASHPLNIEGDLLPSSSGGLEGIQTVLVDSESQCRSFMEELDQILLSLTDLTSSHTDITGRSNALMANCENLLEQQHMLQSTVEELKSVLTPFNEIEEVAGLLGIPIDARGKAIVNAHTIDGSKTAIDPRSADFQRVLARLAIAFRALKKHRHMKGSEKYQKWLEAAQNRAASLIAKAMRELLDNASTACRDNFTKNNSVSRKLKSVNDQPLESSPIYQKFRGLGFRMRELSSLLTSSHCSDASTDAPPADDEDSPMLRRRSSSTGSMDGTGMRKDSGLFGRSDVEIIREVKQGYVILRNELLVPFVRDVAMPAINVGSGENGRKRSVSKESKGSNGGSGGGENHHNGMADDVAAKGLCSGIREAYTVLLRIAQLEQQLYDSLFRPSSPSNGEGEKKDDEDGAVETKASVVVSPKTVPESNPAAQSAEVLSIVETVSTVVADILRPKLIRESDVDELCRIVSTLTEDIRSQITTMRSSKAMVRQLLHGLDRTVSDAQERLSYCAEMRLRKDVQMFEALPSQLAYPEILELYRDRKAALHKGSTEAGSSSDNLAASVPDSGAAGAAELEDVSSTWYPPLRSTLGLLSRLYGVVEMGVFEDFARRSVQQCVTSLRAGAEGVKRSRSQLHGDLFLVRHLLVLREQLLPFEIRLQSVVKGLDFKPTGQALSHLALHARSLLRLDSQNGILQLAWEGLPAMRDTQIDAKRDLDHVLKTACLGLKQSALKMLLGSLDAFLAKVSAFAGDIPMDKVPGANGSDADLGAELAAPLNTTSTVMLTEASQTSLKNQAFVRPERMKEMLDSVQQTAVQNAPDLRDIMKLYVENAVARTILLKPVQQEIGIARLRMGTVIRSCVKDANYRREVEQLLQSVVTTVLSELGR